MNDDAEKKGVWTQVSPNLAVHAFIHAEYSKAQDKTKAALDTSLNIDVYPDILTKPDFNSPSQNARRLRALLSIRRWMWFEFPPDCQWYRVVNFEFSKETDGHIRTPWPALTKDKTTIDLDNLLLFTHDRKEYTVIEGNHRVTRWRDQPSRPTTLATVFVCVSNDLCKWHHLSQNAVSLFEAHNHLYDKPTPPLAPAKSYRAAVICILVAVLLSWWVLS
jgi:hypothetical protein